MKVTLVALASLELVAGFPGMSANRASQSQPFVKRDEPTVRDPVFISNRPNTGISDLRPTFNATAQFVNVGPGSGHEFHPPGPNDLRGPCPGLNAAANHGFIPRNGILTTSQTVTGLAEAFNVGPTFAIPASALGIVYAGDLLAGTWSIGGSYPPLVPLPLLNNPPGLLGSHGKYEGDGSPTRGDAYLNGGNPDVLDMKRFTHLYNLGLEYTHDMIAQHAEYAQADSRATDPYFFVGPVGTILIPGAPGLIVNLMSNHSADVPGGTLNRDVLKSFYSVVGEPGTFNWTPGHERIPDNWYKRPQPLGIENIALDAVVNNAMYPGQLALGGNVGKVDTFTVLDLSNLTGGVFNAQNVLEGNNLACFVLSVARLAIPGQLSSVLPTVGNLVARITGLLGGLTQQMECPQLNTFRKDLFAQFPGGASFLS